ncbi:MAG TPA: succinylglutamate desuccinylase/aspartoacylase family protein [Thermoanaerobaculia bacterium]
MAGWGIFELGGRRVAPGESADIRLEVSESYTAEAVAVPVTVIRGARRGPTLFLTASIHGDELNGVGIVRDLLNDSPFADLAGTLVAVPVANVPAFLNQDRRLPDRRDLNRSFPGSAKGSLTSRLAHALFSGVIRRSDFGIDLHTAAAERANYPHVRVDLADAAAAELARAFGCELLVDGAGPDRSLRRAARAAGVPTIVYEAGSPRRFERPFIEVGKRGVLNVMRHLGMLAGEPEPPPLQVEVRDTHWLRARAGGILDLKAELGQPLRRGAEVSINTSPFGRERSVLKAPHPGVVLGLTRLPLVHPGDAICHLARLPGPALARWRELWESGRVRYG